MLLQFRKLQNESQRRRREENNKFLFKRFFKFIQKRSNESPDSLFETFYLNVLSQQFQRSEIDEYFKNVRDTPPLFGLKKSVQEHVYKVPCKINSEFEERLLRIPSFREELTDYMHNQLVEQTKNDLKDKGVRFLFRFYLIFKEIDCNMISTVVSNHMFSKKCKAFWTVKDVHDIIEEMDYKIKRANTLESTTGSIAPEEVTLEREKSELVVSAELL